MTYSHSFWELFGLPILDWDQLPYGDFLWMRAAADEHGRQQKEAAAR